MTEPMRTEKSLVWQHCAAEKTRDSARRLGAALPQPARIYLSGALGAGKTFWVRALLQNLGVREAVVSPSYVVAVSYAVAGKTIHHLDCYRLQGRQLGEESRELLDDDNAVAVLEWPENAAGLPPRDLHIYFEDDDEGGADSRRITFVAHSGAGKTMLQALQ